MDRHPKVHHGKKTFGCFVELNVRVGTNGKQGGDGGHGGRSYVKFLESGDSFQFSIAPDKKGVTIHCMGDDELEALIEGLRYAADYLDKRAAPPYDGPKRDPNGK